MSIRTRLAWAVETASTVLRKLSPVCQTWTANGGAKCDQWRGHNGNHRKYIRSPEHDYTWVEWDDHGNIEAW